MFNNDIKNRDIKILCDKAGFSNPSLRYTIYTLYQCGTQSIFEDTVYS